MNKKAIIQAETLPYQAIFNLTKERLNLIQARQEQIKVKWEITAKLKEIANQLNEIDEQSRREIRRVK